MDTGELCNLMGRTALHKGEVPITVLSSVDGFSEPQQHACRLDMTGSAFVEHVCGALTPATVRVVYRNQWLDESKTLAQNGVCSGSTLYLAFRTFNGVLKLCAPTG